MKNKIVTKELALAYKKYLQEKQYAVRSINSMIASLNSFFDFNGWSELKLKALKQQKQTYCSEEKELTKAEYMRLLGAAQKKRQLNLIIQTICSNAL